MHAITFVKKEAINLKENMDEYVEGLEGWKGGKRREECN